MAAAARLRAEAAADSYRSVCASGMPCVMSPDFTGLHSLYYPVHLQNLQQGVCREVRALIKLLMNLTIRDVVDFGGDSDQPLGQVNIAQVSQKSLFVYTLDLHMRDSTVQGLP